MMMAVMAAITTTKVGTTTRGMEMSQLAPAYPLSQLEQTPLPVWPDLGRMQVTKRNRRQCSYTVTALPVLASAGFGAVRAVVARFTGADVGTCTIPMCWFAPRAVYR